MPDATSMTAEAALARFVVTLDHREVPGEVLETVKNIVLAVAGTAVGGAGEEGVDDLRALLLEQGGKPEATVLVYGDRLPAKSAAMLNSMMARALDYCDAMVPGVHLGSSIVPAALVAAEQAGGVTGSEWLSALTAGLEVGSRLNVSEQAYGGRDPTGVAALFAATAAAARILRLDERQTLHALALGFNRCAGSVQSNVDASLAVRLIQGWTTEAAIDCVRLAQLGFTGPVNFIDGVFGYSRIFARGESMGRDFIEGLGERFTLQQTMFKRYPSCGLTQGATDLALQAAREAGASPQTIVSAEIRLPAFARRIVGGSFKLGSTPRVNAQFSAQFCVANAWVRGASKLDHFRHGNVGDPEILRLIERIRVVEDESLNASHQSAVGLAVRTKTGDFENTLQVSPGFPPNKLSAAEHLMHFRDCMQYAAKPLSPAQQERIPELIFNMEDLPDARQFLPEFIAKSV